MTDTYTPPLPSEFRSGNSVSVERATITRARMAEILAEAVEAYQRQHAAESLLLGRILSTWHNTGETGDVDGGWLQDVVIAAGLTTQGDEGYVLTPRAMELIGLAAGERS